KLYESLMEEFDAIKAEYEAYKEQAEAYKQQVEYEKAEARKNLLARNRYDELIKAGLMFSEETSAKIMKKIREQTDEEFTEFKESLMEEFDAIKAEYEAYKEQAEAYKQQVEYEKAEARKNLLARNRYDELIKAGLMFSEETSAKIMKKIREQTDEEFTEFKE